MFQIPSCICGTGTPFMISLKTEWDIIPLFLLYLSVVHLGNDARMWLSIYGMFLLFPSPGSGWGVILVMNNPPKRKGLLLERLGDLDKQSAHIIWIVFPPALSQYLCSFSPLIKLQRQEHSVCLPGLAGGQTRLVTGVEVGEARQTEHLSSSCLKVSLAGFCEGR